MHWNPHSGLVCIIGPTFDCMTDVDIHFFVIWLRNTSFIVFLNF